MSFLRDRRAHFSVKPRRPAHRSISATPGAVGDVSPEEQSDEEHFERINRRLKFRRSLTKSPHLGVHHRIEVRSEVATHLHSRRGSQVAQWHALCDDLIVEQSTPFSGALAAHLGLNLTRSGSAARPAGVTILGINGELVNGLPNPAPASLIVAASGRLPPVTRFWQNGESEWTEST